MQTSIPPIIYGTAWKKEHTKDFLLQAVRTGFKGIDTACQPKHYHEAGVGEALKVLEKEGFKREELFIQTKFTPIAGQDPLNIPYDKKADLHTQVMQSFEVSKKNLKTHYVDSLVLHSPLSDFKDLETVWKAMEEIAIKGEAKLLGISNIYDIQTLERLYKAAKVKPTVVQNRFYQDTGYDKEIRAFCQTNNIIYQSFWTLTANPHILQSQELSDLSIKYNKDVIQLFFAYLHQIGITPLTGTTNIEHMKNDLLSFDTKLEVHEIETLNSFIFSSL